MIYKEASERIPNASFLYQNVTLEELNNIPYSKYQLEDGINSGLYVIGTNEEVNFLKDKQILPEYGMSFQ